MTYFRGIASALEFDMTTLPVWMVRSCSITDLRIKIHIGYFLILYNANMDFDKLCKDILDIDSKVKFAGVCDESGSIKYGGQRKGVTSLLSRLETKRSNLQT